MPLPPIPPPPIVPPPALPGCPLTPPPPCEPNPPCPLCPPLVAPLPPPPLVWGGRKKDQLPLVPIPPTNPPILPAKRGRPSERALHAA
ncbi:unnamed protein product [Closterium sp. NIES-54]